MEIRVMRATELYQQAGAYFVRIHGMAKAHGITLRREFDEHDGPDTHYIVLLDGEYPVATCRMYPLGNGAAMLGRVVVLPEYRGQGLGLRTVREGLQWLRDEGYRTACIESRDVAVGFYRKLGFRETSDKMIHGDTFDCVPMQLDLTEEC